MPFTALRFDPDRGMADAWGDALLDAGALSVDASDPFAGTPDEQAHFDEPGAGEAAPWRVSRLVALFRSLDEANAALAAAAGALDETAPSHETYAVADEDWVRATQSQFGPVDVLGRLAIVPSWCDPLPDRVTLRLDPGLAFGTGSHPTTRLCLEWLLDRVTARTSLLDYGCGSGVLAIAAAKLGASDVVGIDVDAQAVRASEANARANGVVATFVSPDALPMRTFDVVVANILANPLMLLAPAIAARVAQRGQVALAGILDAQADAVVNAYARWFTLARWRGLDGWTLLAGERNANAR